MRAATAQWLAFGFALWCCLFVAVLHAVEIWGGR
jgi:hypothetical protein